MKQLFIIILSIAYLLLSLSCKVKNGNEEIDEQEKNKKIKSLIESDRLLIITENYPPFNYEKDGELQG